jgi:hypothetical protein
MAVFLRTTLLAVCLAAPAAAEDADRQACLAAADKGQALLKERKLVDAREALASCARDVCPGLVKRDCTGWLEQAQAAMPTIVVAARDAQGRDVVDGRVVLDAETADRPLDGKALEIDPGPHTIKVLRLGREPVTQSVVVRENEKGRTIVLQLEPLAPPPAPVRADVAPPPSTPAIAPLVLAGVGLTAGAVGAYFGIKGLSDRSSLGCQSGSGGCAHADYTQVQREFVVADVALGVAVVSVAAAAILYFAQRPPQVK